MAASLVSAPLAAPGCAHDPYDGRVYHAGRASFRTSDVPPTWKRLAGDVDGPLLVFRDTASGGSASVNVQCGRDADDVPLTALTKHLLIGFTERQFEEERLVPLDRREALHTVVRAKLDGVPRVLDIYVMKKDGCVYDLVFAADPSRWATGAATFRSFVDGFGTVGG